MAVLFAAFGGCSAGPQSVLDPAGSGARQALEVGEIFTAICLAVYLLVAAVLLQALLRSRQIEGPVNRSDVARLSPAKERRLVRVVIGATLLTAVTLLGLLITELVASDSIESIGGADPVTIEVIGRQWWWEVRYTHDLPSQMVITANEIHLPAGRPVELTLMSHDVIHSFWIPNLHGKRDMIPGSRTTLRIEAERPGEYMGQCAEYCGLQHALMRFVVVVKPPDEFAEWLEAQRRPAVEPVDDQQRRGRELFLSTTCIMCHTVRGTPAFATVGPDLTHLASRRTLGAGALPNTPGHLAGWIMDPQQIKAGARMPQHAFRPDELRDLLSYLESLK